MKRAATLTSSSSNEFFEARFKQQCVMAILRGLPPAATVELCEAAWAAGIEVVEVTLQRPEAIGSLEAAVVAARRQGRTVGAGTVTSTALVEQAANAGAVFTVSPGLDDAVALSSLAHGLPHLPGVATAGEIQRAALLGLSWLKAFPAAQLTPGWFKAMLGPFPGVRFVATGGVDAKSAPGFLQAGVWVVGTGSALADPAQVGLLAALRRPTAPR
jgi:2-dehydro-3-deoxyphosphogluconate aldolase / (4S)-4-hydroxy-2-oxoglutarate aldolase